MSDTPDLTECLHICSNSSAAGCIKEMLREITGKRGLPVILSEMMENTAPLGLLDNPAGRLDWYESIGFDISLYLAFDSASELVSRWEEFWTRIDAWDGPILLWISRFNALDQSLQLAVLNRAGRGRPLFIADVAEPAGDLPGICGVGGLAPEKLRAWIPRARKADAAASEQLNARHAALASAPKGIRLYTDGDLLEAPFDAQDTRILSQFSPEWRPLSRAVAQTPGAFGNGGFVDLDYTWLLWRLEELRKSGRIERRGSGFDPQYREDPLGGEVRLCA